MAQTWLRFCAFPEWESDRWRSILKASAEAGALEHFRSRCRGTGDPGFAASPPVRYTLQKGREILSPFAFSRLTDVG
jgi:hypothetical protein